MEGIRTILWEGLQIILWLGLIVPWVVFFFLADRNNIRNLFSVGLLIALITVIFDVFGANKLLWAYPVELIPVFFIFFPVDLAILPVEAMLIVQYMPKNFPKQVALVFAVTLLNFVLESMMEGDTGAIFYFHWSPIYSFPSYVGLFYLGYIYHKWLVKGSDKKTSFS